MASLAAHSARAGPGCRRFAGDVGALDDEDAPTLAGEVVGDGTADDAAADDGDVGCGWWHGLLLFSISGWKRSQRFSSHPQEFSYFWREGDRKDFFPISPARVLIFLARRRPQGSPPIIHSSPASTMTTIGAR